MILHFLNGALNGVSDDAQAIGESFSDCVHVAFDETTNPPLATNARANPRAVTYEGGAVKIAGTTYTIVADAPARAIPRALDADLDALAGITAQSLAAMTVADKWSVMFVVLRACRRLLRIARARLDSDN